MAAHPLLAPLEDVLNRNIADSARARRLLARVDGRALELRVAATPLRLRISAGNGRVSIGPGADAPADATIEGTPLALARLAWADDAQRAIRAGGVQVSGDGEVAQGFQQLLEVARPEFEEELSRLTGDVAAHHIARFARGARNWMSKARDTAAMNVAEYLTEESRDLPARSEADEFLAAVDALREATDRLEARIARLERGGRA